MVITTWNVNGVRARKERILSWLDKHHPTILCLQETRCEDLAFPYIDLRKYYPYIIHRGQKKSNGVAILSKYKMRDIDMLPLFDDQCRAIACTVKNVRIINLYVIQGQNLESERYPEKLAWWENFTQWYGTQKYENIVTVGDFNIAPTELDVWCAKHWHNKIVTCTDAERDAYFKFLSKYNLNDSVRSLTDKPSFTWHGYREWKWEPKNPLRRGIRIDFVIHTKTLKPLKFHIDTEETLKFNWGVRPFTIICEI